MISLEKTEHFKKYSKIVFDTSMNITDFIIEKCKENNLKISMAFGTALGAIRHKGFIPWDDDMDFVMVRNEYEKLLSILEKDKPEWMVIANEKTFPKRGVFNTRIFDTRGNFDEGLNLKYNYPKGIFVDIFPLDQVPKNKIRRKWHKFWCYVWDTWAKKKTKTKYRKKRYHLAHFLTIWPTLIMPFAFIMWNSNRVFTKFNKKDTGIYSCTSSRSCYTYIFEKDDLQNVIDVPFMDRQYPLIKNWERMLTSQYGDYMTPPSNPTYGEHFVKAKSKDDLVSVLIPCYNVEKYVAQCLNSVMNQTFKNLEIVCVNDGSTDGTLNILNTYAEKDKRIKVISKENAGLSQARKTAFENCSGDFVVNLDSDDLLYSNNSIKKMYDLHEPKRDVTSFTFRPYYDDTHSGFIKYSIFNRVRMIVPGSRKIMRYNWYMWAKMFNRSYLEMCEFNNLNRAEDKQFFIDNPPPNSKIYNIPVVKYRVRKSSIMRKK